MNVNNIEDTDELKVKKLRLWVNIIKNVDELKKENMRQCQ